MSKNLNWLWVKMAVAKLKRGKSKRGHWDENHWEYHCPGCKDPHPSFWKTVVTSDAWKAWYRVAHDYGFDVDESQECNAFSPAHFKAFLDYTFSQRAKEKIDKPPIHNGK